MPTRREILAGILAGTISPRTLLFGKASQPATPVNFEVPPHGCDCHTHIYGDPAKFPLSPTRVYTPEPALPQEMLSLHRALHMERVVIVTPSVYGTDNSATLYGMKARGPNARGIAVIGENTPPAALDAMQKAGVRGIRINAATGGSNDPAAVGRLFQQSLARLDGRKWHIQMYTTGPVIAGIKNLLRDSPVPLVFDHFGGAQAALGLQQPGFPELLDLVTSGKAYVKISGAYRASTQAPDYPDVTPLARALIAANPERILWGSDWPHPDSTARGGVSQFLRIDDGRLLNQLASWASDPALRKKILVDNPARLYGF